MIGKFVILHTIAAAAIGVLILTGAYEIFVQADRVYALPIIGSLTIIGSVLTAMRRADAANWMAERLPTVGLILTVLGIVMVGYNMPAVIDDTTRLHAFREIIGSLVGNLLGISGLLWLNLVGRICR